MPAVRTRLNGFFAEDFQTDERVLLDLRDPTSFRHGVEREVEIGDARALQAQGGSEAEVFERHGFVLLAHRTAVADWSVDPALPPAATPVARTYFPEIEALIRERLLPGRAIMVQQYAPPLRRGRDTAIPAYAMGVHQDYGLTAEDFVQSVAAFASDEAAGYWRRTWDRDGVEGYTNMAGPLKHMPLALCEPASVDIADVVPTGFLNLSPTGRPTVNLGLRHNPEQRWWFYPDMVADEVLAFLQFHRLKRDGDPVLRTCFHTAFADPGAPADAEPRQSCEHRVGVWLLRE
jgi:hypothetical protein